MGADNAATLPGEQQAPKPPNPMHECGESGGYGPLKRKGRARPVGEKKNTFERDHVPSKAAITKKALKGRQLTPVQKSCVKNRCRDRAMAIVIPAQTHRQHSRTCGNKNKALSTTDANDLDKARDKDIETIQKALDGPPKDDCADAYRKAAEEVKKHDIQNMIDQIIKDCTTP